MAITGVHTLIYSSEADAVREIMQDAFGWHSVDAGDGWLIFATPPGEMAVHPGERPRHEITLMCDDLKSTMADLAEKAVQFVDGPSDEGWGVVVTMLLPGDVKMLLYEPRHETAF
ncbi:MAG: extradiol dioxygenase [Acidimicrobiia bacterium]|nr:extradiol dioxygenase [Acidimicrobiia bacterium]NNC42598.1 extradiol dioxygenase [Acidimicrobiia bacterium]NNL28056.1 extradiol dioxygenase [Acidimicrobiia bacterium]